ncbi:MAG TPA: hypothetical protein VGL70_11995 [Candidatus Binatia bacterium]|jgi:hypothetical protein
MTDQEIIDRAYAATIEKIYSVLFDALLMAKDAVQRKDAEDRFQAGVRKAREIRERAKQLLP